MGDRKSDKGDRWFSLVDNLGVFSTESERAVYKPLLTLLIFERAQAGGANRFYFEEIESRLDQLIRQFSKSRRPRCNYPFWYLQSDGYWEVNTELGPAKTRKGKSSEPTAKGLREAKAYGSVPGELWNCLVTDRELILDLADRLISDYWPSGTRNDVANVIGFDLCSDIRKVGLRDPKFRDSVLRAYNFQCAICGFDGRIASEVFGVEAAHIQAKSAKLGNGPDIVQNGIALCSLHHKAFDYGAISLNSDYRILVSGTISGNHTVSELVRDYANKNLAWKPYQEANWPGSQFMAWHRKNLFREPAI